jgi:hypothetical protein
MERSQRLRNVVGGLVTRLDRCFGLDRARYSERFWLVPASVLVGTILGFFVIGEVTAAPLYVSLPNGVFIAAVMSGLAVACLTPSVDSGTDDPPGGDDGTPVLGSPGGPWTVVAHLGANHQPADHELVLR